MSVKHKNRCKTCGRFIGNHYSYCYEHNGLTDIRKVIKTLDENPEIEFVFIPLFDLVRDHINSGVLSNRTSEVINNIKSL